MVLFLNIMIPEDADPHLVFSNRSRRAEVITWPVVARLSPLDQLSRSVAQNQGGVSVPLLAILPTKDVTGTERPQAHVLCC